MKSLSYLNKYLWKYKWLLILGFVFIIISNIFGVWSPVLVRDAFDDVKESVDKYNNGVNEEIYYAALKTALYYGLFYMLFALIKGIFLFFTRQTLIVMSRHIEYDLKNDIYQHYQVLDSSFYKRNNTGDLMNRISEDVTRVRMYLGPGIMYTVNLIVLFVMIIGQMINVNPMLTLYVLLPLPILSFIIYLVSNQINKKSELQQIQQSKLTTTAQESFAGINIIKSYSKENSTEANFNKESELYRMRILSLVKTDSWFGPIIILLVGLSTIITVYIGGKEAIKGNISLGNIAEFVIYVNMLTWPFASVGWVSSLIQRAAASQVRINEFLNSKPDIDNLKGEIIEPKGKIEFKDVEFTYSNTGIKALNKISFTINEGETLAIIGKTGSGKSTIASLITRQYDPENGTILLDDKNLKDFQLLNYRKYIGYVPQEVFLFSDSIENNIAFGAESFPPEKIENAAKDADIYANIMEFPDQFKTVVGERGIMLSGGQKQRISIARAIIKEPTILIFDDCLSAVDTETEDRILTSLKRIMKNRTSIIISHRVSSVKNADNIIVMHQGKIIEQGNHIDLLNGKSHYYELYQKQLHEKSE
jgi:ATP-binding cassette subfamily B multidrug efflux pump